MAKRVSEEIVTRWLSFFRPPVAPTPSPKPERPLPEEKRYIPREPSAAIARLKEQCLQPVEELPAGPYRRQFFIRNGMAFERMPDGSEWFAEVETPEESLERQFLKKMDREINSP